MKVLIDARSTRRMSVGMRSYVGELVARLPVAAPDLEILTFSRGENFTLAEQFSIPLAARAADVVHFPTIFAPIVLPPRYVLTIHDLIHLRFPSLFGRRTAAYYRLLVGRLARRAARVIVGDVRTVVDCEKFLGVAPAGIRVVPLGYDPALLGAPVPAAPRPYVLYLGNHRPHKNLTTLLEAYRGLPASIELDLYLSGIDDIARPPGGRPPVFLGSLSRREAAGRVRGALALVQPSLAEGYGLPVLEAMAAGTPVLASEASVPADLAAFAATFEARDAAALRSLLEEAATAPNRLRGLAAEGERVARAYTWDRFAASTASVYREALEGSPRS